MIDWVDDRKKLLSGIGEFGELSPGTVTGYQSLIRAGQASRLDARTRELIALAVAVTAQCDGCITVHVAEALKYGASKAEIAQALGVGSGCHQCRSGLGRLMSRRHMRNREISAGVWDALDEPESEVTSTGLAAGAEGASDPEGLARERYLLTIAVNLMANLFEQLQSVQDDDAALDRNLTIEGHLISAQIVEAQDVVSQLNFAANGANDAELMARARVIVGPLGRKLDRLAGDMNRRGVLHSDTLSVDGDFFREWIESSLSFRSH